MGTRGRTPALPDAGDANAPYNALTNTPLAGLHQQGPLAFLLEKFNEGESVRKATWRCGINTKAASSNPTKLFPEILQGAAGPPFPLFSALIAQGVWEIFRVKSSDDCFRNSGDQ